LKLPRPCAGLLQLKIGIQGENTTVVRGKLSYVCYLRVPGNFWRRWTVARAIAPPIWVGGALDVTP